MEQGIPLRRSVFMEKDLWPCLPPDVKLDRDGVVLQVEILIGSSAAAQNSGSNPRSSRHAMDAVDPPLLTRTGRRPTLTGQALLTRVDRLSKDGNQVIDGRVSNGRQVGNRTCLILRIPRVVGEVKLTQKIDIVRNAWIVGKPIFKR
jgi:hypothetical protein